MLEQQQKQQPRQQEPCNQQQTVMLEQQLKQQPQQEQEQEQKKQSNEHFTQLQQLQQQQQNIVKNNIIITELLTRNAALSAVPLPLIDSVAVEGFYRSSNAVLQTPQNTTAIMDIPSYANLTQNLVVPALLPTTTPQQTQESGEYNLSTTKGRTDKHSVASSSSPRRSKSFPLKLWDAMRNHANDEAFEWLPDGKSFIIINPDIFCSEILDNCFKSSKYGSFIRKLHRYGFLRLTSGTGTDCFHHPLFQRSQKNLVGKIECIANEKKDSKGTSKLEMHAM